MNIVEPILYQCKLNPFAVAIATPGSGIKSVKYGQLERLIHNIARSAMTAGLGPGDVAAVYVGDPILHAALLLGLMRIGVATVSLTGPSLPQNIKISAIVTNIRQAFAGAANVVRVDVSWIQGDGSAPDYERIYRTNGDDVCRIFLTSGSTGWQKGISFTHQMLFEKLLSSAYVKGALFARTARVFSGLPVETSPGFRYMMFALIRGQTIYFSGPEPTDILQFLAAYNVEGLAISPHDLRNYLGYFQADPTLSSTFNVIVCQGARLSQMIADAARMRLCQNLYTSYGATETGTVACGPAHNLVRIPNAVGFICPGVTVEIVDDEDRQVPAGREGHIRIRSPHMAKEYVGDAQATAQMFRNGWFYPGDLGSINAEGMLLVTGRTKTALSVGGDNVAPEIIEEALCAFPGVEAAAAFNLHDSSGMPQIHALLVLRGELDEAALRAHCTARLREVLVPTHFVPVNEIPRTAQGKIDRPAVLAIGRSRLNPN